MENRKKIKYNQNFTYIFKFLGPYIIEKINKNEVNRAYIIDLLSLNLSFIFSNFHFFYLFFLMLSEFQTVF